MMVHLLLILLLSILVPTVRGVPHVKGTCATGAPCEGEDLGAESSLLQTHSGSAGSRRLVAPPQGYPLSFGIFMFRQASGPVLPFRLTIETEIMGINYTMMVDTGSSVLALCNGTTDIAGAPVPAAKPMPDGEGPWAYDVELYGASNHGFTSAIYHGEYKIGGVTSNSGTESQYQTMLSKRGERGNACLIPIASPVLHDSRIEGIFGFAGPGARSEPFLCDTVYADLIPGGTEFPQCPEENKKQGSWPGPFTSLDGAEQFGITLDGFAASLFMGKDATALLETTYKDSKPVAAAMKWTNGLYYYMLKSYGVRTADGPLAAGTVACQEVCSGYVDTGNPYTSLPPATFDALGVHFANSTTPVTLEIAVGGPENSINTLAIQLTAAMWKYNVILFKRGEDAVIGLSAWFWFEHVHFDVEKQIFAFVPRRDMALVNAFFSEYMQQKVFPMPR